MTIDTNPDITHPYNNTTKKLMEWVDEYHIGSEGGSAWVWFGSDPNDMTCFGKTGPTRVEAITRLLFFYWQQVEKPLYDLILGDDNEVISNLP